MILLNKAHYWVLKQHTDSTPWLLHSKDVLPLNGHSCYFHCYRVPATTQSTIPAFCVPCKSVFRDSHHNVSFLNSSNITIQMTWESSKQETKTLYNWKPVKPLLTRRNTEEVLRFFLLAAATHTTIQTPKRPCNPKMGEVGHKQGLERVSNTLTNIKQPSQCVLWVLKNL